MLSKRSRVSRFTVTLLTPSKPEAVAERPWGSTPSAQFTSAEFHSGASPHWAVMLSAWTIR